MCGIAGIFRYASSNDAPLDERVGLRMIEQLVHRGPDDGGLLVTPSILLGHRRLSILDLSERGWQPMSDEQGRYWISFNGEIYNYREIRSELQQAGHSFRSQTDTEVILRGYMQWGPAVVERLNGMFAFALWDSHENRLWLVRDAFGIKPLYYYDDGQCLWFASEIKALLADSLPRNPDWQGVDTFLTFGYAAAPASGFEGIRQVQPGEYLDVRSEGVARKKWFQLPYPEAPTNWSERESIERLDDAIAHAVKRQMVSDVPLGALLSGGLDSTAIVRAASRAQSRAVETFTIGFEEASFDERRFASAVATHFHTAHHEQCVSAQSDSLLPLVAGFAEEPFADNSMLPFFLLSQFVREHVTVALSGDGADELLGGYDTYRASQFAPYYRAIPRWVRRGIVSPLVNSLPPSTAKYGRTAVLQRFVGGAEAGPLRDHCSWRQYLTDSVKQQLYTPAMHQHRGDPIQLYASAADECPEWLTPFEQQMHMDLCFHLPNDMLVKADRMSMAHSLEVRVPLLDLEVVRTCLAIPAKWKRRGRRGKWVLRQILARELSSHIINRRKSGFLIPLEKWMRHQWQPLLRRHLTEQFAVETGILRWPVLRQMMDDQAAGRRDYAYPLLALLMLALWWQNWIRSEPVVKRPVKPFAKTRIVRLVQQERAE